MLLVKHHWNTHSFVTFCFYLSILLKSSSIPTGWRCRITIEGFNAFGCGKKKHITKEEFNIVRVFKMVWERKMTPLSNVLRQKCTWTLKYNDNYSRLSAIAESKWLWGLIKVHVNLLMLIEFNWSGFETWAERVVNVEHWHVPWISNRQLSTGIRLIIHKMPWCCLTITIMTSTSTTLTIPSIFFLLSLLGSPDRFFFSALCLPCFKIFLFYFLSSFLHPYFLRRCCCCCCCCCLLFIVAATVCLLVLHLINGFAALNAISLRINDKERLNGTYAILS